jgi:outer membrane protein TolC
MHPNNGPRPDTTLRRVRHAAATPALTFLLAACAAVSPAVGAADTAALTLPEAEALALANDPLDAALSAEADSFDAAAAVAEALPDPTLRVGLNNYPIESGNFSSEAMTNAGISYRQAFPGGRVREYRGDKLQWQSRGKRHEARLHALEVRLSVRQRWLDVYLAERSSELIAESRSYFEDLAEITESLYSVGRKTQQDVLRADLEVSRLEHRLLELQATAAMSRGYLSEWIGAAANRGLPAELPVLPAVPRIAMLREGLSGHPRLAIADARIEAARADVLRADERSKPGWALDVGYGFRDGMQPSGDSRSDLATVGVTVELPFFSRTSVDSTLASALADRSAAEARREALQRMLAAELEAEYARWELLNRRLALFEERILAQSGATAEAALLAYQSDAADFADVVRAQVDDLDARLEALRLQVEKARSQAVLAYLGGPQQ